MQTILLIVAVLIILSSIVLSLFWMYVKSMKSRYEREKRYRRRK